MTIRMFLMGIFVATVICFFVWLAIIIFINPFESGSIILLLFYFSLFLWLVGSIALIVFFIRYFLQPRAIPYAILTMAIRQAIIFAFVAVIILALKGLKALSWANGFFLLIAAIFTEGYFLSNNNEQHSHRNR